MVSLYDPKAIKAEINGLLDEAKTLAKLAESEEREPSKDETARISEIMDLVGEDGDDGPTGLRAKLATAERYQKMLAENRGVQDTPAVPSGGVHTQTGGEPFRVPPSALARARSGRIKAFREGTSERPLHDAYAAGMWLFAVLGSDKAKGWCGDNGIGVVQAAMVENDNSLGGFFVPDEMSARIIDMRYQYGLARRHAFIEPMTSDTKKINRRKDGVTAYAVNEGTSVTASDLTFNQVELIARAWAALTKMSRELDEDAVIMFADRVAGEMGWAFAKKEDESVFIGDATSTYHGVRGVIPKANDGSHAGAIYTPAAGTLAFSDLTLAMFESMVGQLPSWADEGAAWYIHKAGWAASIMRLQMAAGGNTTVDVGNGPELSFLGYPVRFNPVMNSTLTDQASTAGLAVLANLELAVALGDRRGFSFQVLNERFADTRQIGLLGDTRVAINPHSVTDPADATGATAGPVVVLKTPAS